MKFYDFIIILSQRFDNLFAFENERKCLNNGMCAVIKQRLGIIIKRWLCRQKECKSNEKEEWIEKLISFVMGWHEMALGLVGNDVTKGWKCDVKVFIQRKKFWLFLETIK